MGEVTCDCISPSCRASKHVDLECHEPATVRLVSRDWDGKEYGWCSWCAREARVSGMFQEVAR